MTQPPVRFENYPPDDNATPDSPEGEHAPVIQPYVPEQLPRRAAGGGRTSRRTLIGLVVGIPAVLVGLVATRSGGNSMWDPMPGGPLDEPSDEATGDPVEDGSSQTIEVGDYSAPVPDGWTMTDDDSGTVVVTNGMNRLTAVSIETGTSTLAVDEIASLAKPHYTGFTGTIGEPADHSSAELQHATMDGTGKFKGRTARLMAEFWIDDEGSGLLVTRLLTAKVASTIAVEAQEMLDELSEGF